MQLFVANSKLFAPIGLALAFLLAISASHRSRDWILPCHASRTSCNMICGVRSSLFRTCDHRSGYCLCSYKATPKNICRPPRIQSELKDCNTTTCERRKGKRGVGNSVAALVCSHPEEGSIFCGCFLLSNNTNHP
ncbi:unnamed protein product [Orchesella dallaii]|uniref:Secreted protein n=1 Tax=Orchesella dallaii TaxID=48710 RepID=A0ABP1QPS9_9HEXA